ncbi:hypothetical protein B5X24_HaOG214078 [Helicoverpa armigera]|nr:hypothetical protein B5X24_HaOG214078 [Helicoverpa armigera]
MLATCETAGGCGREARGGRGRGMPVIPDRGESFGGPAGGLKIGLEGVGGFCEKVLGLNATTLLTTNYLFERTIEPQIPLRLPTNMKTLESCKLMSPKNATSQMKPDITNLAKPFKTVCNDVDSVVQEGNALHRTTWKSTQNTEEFWVEVYGFKNAVGDKTLDM